MQALGEGGHRITLDSMAQDIETPPPADTPPPQPAVPSGAKPPPKEVGGPKGPEPTRYGDWEQKGRCTDF